jgi:ribosomal RNA-processing protein 7
MSALPASIAGFTIIPVTYSSSTHIIYARPHSGSKKTPKQTLPNGRTLFLVNVPPDATERELILLFKHAGTVEKVVFDDDVMELLEAEESESEREEGAVMEDESQEQPRKKRKVLKDDTGPPKVSPLPRTPLRTLRKTGACAHVIFLDSSSLERALTTPQKSRPWPRSPDEPSGLAHYTALYDSLRPPLDVVREHADTSMELYEYELARSKQKYSHRKGEAVVDEDGFTLVTRGGAYGKTLGGGVGVANKTFDGSSQNQHGRKKKEGKEKDAFYAFQKAEKQRKGMFPCRCFNPDANRRHAAIMDLKKNWEADKAKVEKLKESRRFKPY